MKKNNLFALSTSVVATALFASTAHAQVCDDFESYTAGKEVVPQSDGVWEWWCDWNQGPMVVDDHAYSGTKSLRMTPNDDIVYVVTDAQNNGNGEYPGTWILRAMTYFSSDETGQVYLMALDEYFDEWGDCDPGSWAMQILFDLGSGIVTAVFHENETTPLIYDEWVEFRAVVDLNASFHDIYYGNTQFVDDRPWSMYWAQLECINLFSASGTGWYDDVAATREEDYCFGEVICPEQAIVHRGIETGGGFDNICESDRDRWHFQPDMLAATFVAPIRLEFISSTTEDSRNILSFQIKNNVSHDGMIIRIDIWNYTTESWEGTVFYDVPTWHYLVNEVIKSSNVSDYINEAGEVKAQASYLRPAGMPPFWEISIDHVKWFIE